MTHIHGCKCSVCGEWHSHVKKRNNKYICVNCWLKQFAPFRPSKTNKKGGIK